MSLLVPQRLLCSAALLCATTLPAAEDLRAFVPLDPQPEPSATVGKTAYRGRHEFLVYAPAAGQQWRGTVRANQVGKYKDEVSVTALGAEDAVLAEHKIPVKSESELVVTPPQAGAFRLRVDTGQNSASLVAANGWLAVEASSRRHLHVISRAGPLYFYVPRLAIAFTVAVRGAGGTENARLEVLDPASQSVASGESLGGKECALQVEAPAESRGKVWSLKMGRASQGIFEDAYLWLSDDVVPYVAENPHGLLVPFIHGLVRRPLYRVPGAPQRLNVELNLPDAARRGLILDVTIISKDGKALLQQSGRKLGRPAIELQLPSDLKPGEYSARADLRKAGELVASSVQPVTVTPRVIYFGAPQALVRLTQSTGPDGLPVVSVTPNIEASGQPLRLLLRATYVPPRQTRRLPTPLSTPIPGLPQSRRLDDGSILLAEGSLPPQALKVPVPADLPEGDHEWRLELSDGEVLLAVERFHIVRRDKRWFAEARPPDAQPLAPLSAKTQQTGLVAFVPAETEAIPYNYRPQTADLSRPLSLFATPGEYEPATLGLYGLKEFASLSIALSDLAGPGDAQIPAASIQWRVAHYWPQRTSWNTKVFRIIPELLERRETFSVPDHGVAQLWFTVRIPDAAPPGMYRGRAEVRDGPHVLSSTPLEIEILPFKLKRPPHLTWGLYTDSGRWNHYTDERIKAELADYVTHGITGLMIGPFSHGQARYEHGKVTLDLDRFAQLMAWAKEAGLRPPHVMNLQGMNGLTRRLLGRKAGPEDPEFGTVYQAILRGVAERAKRENWGTVYYHIIDEPNRRRPESVARATAEFKLIKELGLPVFTTVLDPVACNEEFDPYLDVRCYSLSYAIGSAEANATRLQEIKDSGDIFWWYGSGCYTFAGGQEGNVLSNRFLTGYAFIKSGATGHWSWTFQRPKNSAYDDFDGEAAHEHKDACITYPNREDTGLVPTFQWEGLREGTDDARYIYTLQELLKGRRDAKARRAARELRTLLDSVPWGIKPREMTITRCRELRRRIADLIVELSRK